MGFKIFFLHLTRQINYNLFYKITERLGNCFNINNNFVKKEEG